MTRGLWLTDGGLLTPRSVRTRPLRVESRGRALCGAAAADHRAHGGSQSTGGDAFPRRSVGSLAVRRARRAALRASQGRVTLGKKREEPTALSGLPLPAPSCSGPSRPLGASSWPWRPCPPTGLSLCDHSWGWSRVHESRGNIRPSDGPGQDPHIQTLSSHLCQALWPGQLARVRGPGVACLLDGVPGPHRRWPAGGAGPGPPGPWGVHRGRAPSRTFPPVCPPGCSEPACKPLLTGVVRHSRPHFHNCLPPHPRRCIANHMTMNQILTNLGPCLVPPSLPAGGS